MSGKDEEVKNNCGMCGCEDVSRSQEDYSFPYGKVGPEQVELTVEIPVFTCKNEECGFQWWNWEASEIVDAYIAQYKENKKYE